MKALNRVMTMVPIVGAAATYGLWKTKTLEQIPVLASGLLVRILNEQRKREKELEYVIFHLPSDIPALPIQVSWVQRQVFGDPPLSLAEIEMAFRRVAEDDRVKGIILYTLGFNMSLADLQTLRDSMLRLRAKGKRVICFAPSYDTKSYYVASAADDIILQTGGSLATIGLQSSLTFMKDALSTLGIEVDAIAISPYKSAADTFTQQEISPELRDQINWLLDSNFEQIVTGIAQGRNLSAETIREMIDQAPYNDQQALEQGYIDGILTEEGLPAYLNAKHLIPWKKADDVVLLRWQPPTDQFVAVIPLSGMIVDGESVTPPEGIPIPFMGAERMGSLTVVEQIRNLMQQEKVAAVVLYVDSGGGSATASEAMTSAIAELAKKHPVVVYMNSVAASGGYYISTPAQWIVAQPATITGSIGVIAAKVVSTDLLKKLRFNTVDFLRGKNAGMESSNVAFTVEQREQVKSQIIHTYQQFIGRVAEGRKLTPEKVDEIGGGRVWTGAQALELGLVDQLGSLHDAIQKAKELANLPEETPALLLKMKLKPLGPQLAEQANPAAMLKYMHTNLDLLLNGQAQFLLPWEWR